MSCTTQDVACGKTFIREFGPKAFRRPLTEGELERFDAFFEAELEASDFDIAMHLTLQVFLQSPQFLYRIEDGLPSTATEGVIQLTQHEIANRMAFMLWSTMPDAALMKAADEGKLGTAEERETQARRMMADKKFQYFATEYFRQWADFERIFEETVRRRPGARMNQSPLDHGGSIPQRGARRGRAVLCVGLDRGRCQPRHDFEQPLHDCGQLRTGHLRRQFRSVEPTRRRIQARTHGDGALRAEPGGTVRFLTRPFFNWTYSRFDTPSPPLRGAFVFEKLLCTRVWRTASRRPEPTGPTAKERQQPGQVRGQHGIPK